MEFKECPDVRLADPEDIPEIIRLFQEYLEENGIKEYSKEKIVNIMSLHYNKNGGIIGVIGEKEKELKGAIVLVVQQNWYNNIYQLQEMSLYVSKNYRKSNYAKQLMIFAKKAAEVLDLELRIGVWSSERTEAKINLYKRQFNFRGAFFSYNEKSRV